MMILSEHFLWANRISSASVHHALTKISNQPIKRNAHKIESVCEINTRTFFACPIQVPIWLKFETSRNCSSRSKVEYKFYRREKFRAIYF